MSLSDGRNVSHGGDVRYKNDFKLKKVGHAWWWAHCEGVFVCGFNVFSFVEIGAQKNSQSPLCGVNYTLASARRWSPFVLTLLKTRGHNANAPCITRAPFRPHIPLLPIPPLAPTPLPQPGEYRGHPSM